MTLIELLVVLAIIALLASLTLPALSRVKAKSKTQRARIELAEIVSAISEYEGTYARYPVSSNALNAAAARGDDLTYGGVVEETHTWIAGPGAYLTNNCELMAVLLDLERYTDGAATINYGHSKNPRRYHFLEPPTSGTTNDLAGLGVDGIYRDPWGSPYLVTLDFNGDGRARDVFYRDPAVSQDPANPAQGLKGLVRNADAAGNVCFEALAPVIAWSAGPDRRVDQSAKADSSVNRDNILSWAR